jgi:pimeloyl-ACP methyl ester carboxylesterase
MTASATRPEVRVLRDDAADGGRTAVLVHGTMDRSASFRAVTRALADWRVLSWDRRGWGESRSFDDTGTTLHDHVDDLCAILDDAPGAVVAGHSYGGLVALCAAARRPDLLAAVVAFEPPVRWLPWWPLETEWEARVKAASGPDEAAETLLRAVLGDAGWDRLTEASRAELLRDGPAVLVEMNDPVQDTVMFDPSELGVPVTVGAGGASIAHHREVAARIAALAPDGTYVEIPGAGHGAHISHPRDFAALITRAADRAGTSHEGSDAR